MRYKTELQTILAAIVLGLSGMSGVAVASDENQPGDFTRGAMQWADNCGRCHNVRDPKELRDDQWISTVYHMRIRAGLTGQQVRDILAFLQESN